MWQREMTAFVRKVRISAQKEKENEETIMQRKKTMNGIKSLLRFAEGFLEIIILTVLTADS